MIWIIILLALAKLPLPFLPLVKHTHNLKPSVCLFKKLLNIKNYYVVFSTKRGTLTADIGYTRLSAIGKIIKLFQQSRGP